MNTISLIIGVLGLFVALFSLYISPPARWELPFHDKYNNLYGNYKIYNISRERILTEDGQLRLVEWNVKIRKRFLKIPEFYMSYKDKAGVFDYFYRGDLIIVGSRLVIRLYGSPRTDEHDDICDIFFIRPRDNKVNVHIGFLSGYRSPAVPYCGVHILCREESLTREEAHKILNVDSSLWYEDFEKRSFNVLESKVS